jgi:cation transport ATPase
MVCVRGATRTIREAGESVIARIVALVEQASATKAKTQLFIEKVEQRYSIAVVVATLALFVVPWPTAPICGRRCCGR